MKQYLDLLQKIKDEWYDKWDRTWTGTKSIFWYQMKFDLQQGFPLLTTKKVYLKAIIHELLWFLTWETNIKYLVDNNVHIRDERPYANYKKNTTDENILSQKEFITKVKDDELFATKRWELWPVYGSQRRNFNNEWIDQIKKVINTLKNNPDSRRILVVTYNPAMADDMLLPPCHALFQFYVANGKLSCQMYQRSADVFLWVPFNIASYSLLTMMIAQVVWLEVWEFIHSLWDVHIYNNHFSQVDEQLSRETRDLPIMKINPNIKDIFDFKYDDFELINYNPHPSIKAPIAV